MKIERYLACCLFTCLSAIALADNTPSDPTPMWGPYPMPWFTGPLLTQSAYIVPQGHINIEPYLYGITAFGRYDAHGNTHKIKDFVSINSYSLIEVGLTEWMDFQINPSIFWQYSQGETSLLLGDLTFMLDFQLCVDTYDNYLPAIKLSLGEVLPTGNYQRLDFTKLGTDGTGAGTYATFLTVGLARLFHIYDVHFIAMRSSFSFTYSAPTYIHNASTYGGGEGTRGWIYPGLNYYALLSFEYNFSQHWAIALDIQGEWQSKDRFSGNPGFLPPTGIVVHNAVVIPQMVGAVKTSVGRPSFRQFSLAPAVEYLFNPSLGIIAGAWFSIAGRNAAQFASGVVAFNYYY